MEDEDYKQDQDEDEELEKGSDTDLVQSILADEGSGLDALKQAIDQTQDPKLKEILQAIEEDETKHNAALQQWIEMQGEGAGEDEAGLEEPPAEPDEGGEEEQIEADAAPEPDEGEVPGDMGEVPDDEEYGEDVEDLGEPSSKADLIDEIRAILAEHDDEAEKADEPEGPGEDDEKDDEDLPDFLKEDDEEEEDGLEKEDDEDEEDEETEKRCSKSIRAAFIAKSQDQQIVYGIISEPDVIDLQGDRLSESEIRKACHKFMMESQRISKEHESEAKADIIESYIAPVDFKCGGQHVKKGSWIMGVKIHDKDLWDEVKKGDLTGFSIAGTGTRTPI